MHSIYIIVLDMYEKNIKCTHARSLVTTRYIYSFFVHPERNAMDVKDRLGLGTVVHGNKLSYLRGQISTYCKYICFRLLLVYFTTQLPMPLGIGPVFFGVLYGH